MCALQEVPLLKERRPNEVHTSGGLSEQRSVIAAATSVAVVVALVFFVMGLFVMLKKRRQLMKANSGQEQKVRLLSS
jgi:hypothetical protein